MFSVGDEVVREMGLQGYDETIQDIIVRLIERNIEKNVQEANLRERRGLSTRSERDAYESITTLFVEAGRSARERGRERIEIDDFIEAYLENYCTVWPVC
jgi:hypothetical protein